MMSATAVVTRHFAPGAGVSGAMRRASIPAHFLRHPTTASWTSTSSGYCRQRVRRPTHRASSRTPRAAAKSIRVRGDDAPVVAVVKTSGCPHCRRAEAALRAAGVAFVEVDVSSPDGVVRDAAAKASGARTVPQVFVGGACLGGADDTIALLESGGFAARVAIAVREKKDALPPSLASVVRAVSGRDRKSVV